MRPPLALAFNSPPRQLSYSLWATIYAGGNHLSVCFCEQSTGGGSGGQTASGALQPDGVRSEAELPMNGTHSACTLRYRHGGYWGDYWIRNGRCISDSSLANYHTR